MEFREAALTVLREEGKPLHWTVIQDVSLKRGYLDPFTQKDIRQNLLRALSECVRAGEATREGTGMYALMTEGG